MQLFDNHGFIRRGQKEKAQELLANLKEKFKSDCKSRTKQGDEEMTQVEYAFFLPAIQEAYAGISIETNSTPSPTWFFELYKAQGTINYYLDQLKEKK